MEKKNPQFSGGFLKTKIQFDFVLSDTKLLTAGWVSATQSSKSIIWSAVIPNSSQISFTKAGWCLSHWNENNRKYI